MMFLVACDPLEEMEPPYRYAWLITNSSSQDVVVYLNDSKDSVLGGDEYNYDRYVEILSGNTTPIYATASGKPNKNFDSFINRLNFLSILTPKKDSVLKEYKMGEGGVSHNLYEESEWDYTEYKKHRSYRYYITYHEWTFTITDEDIGLAE